VVRVGLVDLDRDAVVGANWWMGDRTATAERTRLGAISDERSRRPRQLRLVPSWRWLT
jgi:hypothetical protein